MRLLVILVTSIAPSSLTDTLHEHLAAFPKILAEQRAAQAAAQGMSPTPCPPHICYLYAKGKYPAWLLREALSISHKRVPGVAALAAIMGYCHSVSHASLGIARVEDVSTTCNDAFHAVQESRTRLPRTATRQIQTRTAATPLTATPAAAATLTAAAMTAPPVMMSHRLRKAKASARQPSQPHTERKLLQ